ncbi:MAG: hypothetical protein JJU11_11245 [Candidatus Sumerlaeia bacterium]|nr:hypothetical protein [Candidatus Sumerlaeia bacterium]
MSGRVRIYKGRRKWRPARWPLGFGTAWVHCLRALLQILLIPVAAVVAIVVMCLLPLLKLKESLGLRFDK